jgi:hypothetical protein
MLAMAMNRNTGVDKILQNAQLDFRMYKSVRQNDNSSISALKTENDHIFKKSLALKDKYGQYVC